MATNLVVEVAGEPVQVAAIDVPAGIAVGDQVGLRLPPERMWVVRAVSARSEPVLRAPQSRTEVTL